MSIEMIDFCYELKGRGFSLGIISNFSSVHKYALNPDLFSPIIYTGNTGLSKPDLAIFARFCQQANCQPNECLFIDDSYVNVSAAKDFGMETFLFTSIPDFIEKTQLLGLI
ncbi:MAG: HAD-IA family hydrolase [Candidatus Shapirobacteria bacterium]|nr:HAD-IA family hydrolase [Candidatus Shapirobacteria bacterium]